MNDRLEEIKKRHRHSSTGEPFPDVRWLIEEVEALRVRATEAEAALRDVAALKDDCSFAHRAEVIARAAAAVPDEVTE